LTTSSASEVIHHDIAVTELLMEEHVHVNLKVEQQPSLSTLISSRRSAFCFGENTITFANLLLVSFCILSLSLMI
jgi:hypothetical protein